MSACDCGECEDCLRAILINERDRRLAAEDREATLRERAAAAEKERNAYFAIVSACQDIAAHEPGESLPTTYMDHPVVTAVAAMFAARVQAEAELSRARELLGECDVEDGLGNSCMAYDFDRDERCSYQPHAGICWAHRRDRFLADPANAATPTKEPTR